MSTAPAPTGALSRPEPHEPTGRQTKTFDTTRRPAGGLQSETSDFPDGE
jgi:hypothetical protein